MEGPAINRIITACLPALLALALGPGCATDAAREQAPEPILDVSTFDLARACPTAPAVRVVPAEPASPRLWPSNFWVGAAGGTALASLGVFVAYAAPMFQGAAFGALLLPYLMWEGHENDACAGALRSAIERADLPSRLQTRLSARLRGRLPTEATPPCEVRLEISAYGFVADPALAPGERPPTASSGPVSRHERFALSLEAMFRVLRDGREIHRDRIAWGPRTRSFDLPPPFRSSLARYCEENGAEAERRLKEAAIILGASADKRLGGP